MITNGLARELSIPNATSDMLQTKMVRTPPTEMKIGSKNTTQSGSTPMFDPDDQDPLELIDMMLSEYIDAQTQKASELSQIIEDKSDGISEVNRLWGLVMQKTLPNTDPNSNDTTALLGDQYLSDIDKYIKTEVGDPRGIAVITGNDLENTKGMQTSYAELQEMNATMTAYCDTVQVDIDTEQQNFKNIMTEISSAQEEIRDIRRAIVAVAQGS